MSQDNKFIPFYSEVHPDIREELAFRAECSTTNTRTSEQIEWLNSRSSWGSVTLLQSDKKTVRAAINNPGLSLDRRPTSDKPFYTGAQSKINNKKNLNETSKGTIDSTENRALRSYNPLSSKYLADQYINTRSGRTPPALQSITFTLADTSAGAQGLLNDAQVSILVPDIEFFINEFERTWFRLGYKAIIEIGHSVRYDSRGNYGRFEGNLVNFNFEYQQDGSVNVVLYFKSSTDLATIIPSVNTNNKTEEIQEPESGESQQVERKQDNSLSSKLRSFVADVFATDDQPTTNRAHIFPVNFIEDKVLNNTTNVLVDQEFKFRTLLENENERVKTKTNKSVLQQSSSVSPSDKTTYDIFAAQIDLSPHSASAEGASESGTAYYVSLGMVVKLINANIQAATALTGSSKSSLDSVYVSVAPEFSTSLYFEELVSADHEKVVLPSSETYNSDTYINSNVQVSSAGIPSSKRLGHISNITLPDGTETKNFDKISFYKNDTTNDQIVGVPANILIRIDEIQKIESKLRASETTDKPYDVDQLINQISRLIRKCTGSAIDLKLTSLPTTDIPSLIDEFANTNMLVLRDIKATVSPSTINSTKPTKIPMFVNSITSAGYKRSGTVVRSFKIVGRIPNSLKSINLVLSQTSGIPKDMLAHYLTYIDADTKQQKAEVEKEYEEAYRKNFNNLIQAKLEYYDTPLQEDSKQNLQDALTRYIAVPKKSLSELFKFTSPPYPLDVEIELDGCYGFRFGDILTIEGLPAQYNKFVFSIVKIDHSLLNNDWSTKLTCLMRPKLSPLTDTSTSSTTEQNIKKRND